MAQEDLDIRFDIINQVVSVHGCDQFLLHELSNKNVITADWQQLLSVFVLDEQTQKPINNLAIIGNYGVKDNKIIFSPRFHFDPGLHYLVKFNPLYLYALLDKVIPNPVAQKIVQFTFKVTPNQLPKPTSLTDVYPSGDTIPVNQLKFYIHFSQPIRSGEVYDHIYFLDNKGERLENTFLQLAPELWDQANQRITLWLDPGRIKRDLNPNVTDGLPLQSNKLYQLVIDKDIRDIYGNKLTGQFTKTYFVEKADREKPNPNNWRLKLPSSSNKNEVKLIFDEALDEALLNSMIWIEDKDGDKLKGTIKVGNKGKTWKFSPAHSWENATYFVLVNSKLEDLAGNSIRRLFDTEVVSDQHKVNNPSLLSIQVAIKKRSRQKKIRKWNSRIFNQ